MSFINNILKLFFYNCKVAIIYLVIRLPKSRLSRDMAEIREGER